SAKTLFTSPTNPSIDLRKSTGLLYAKIRRTSGVNHIALASHPQAHAGGECHFHRPRPAHAARRRDCDKLPLRPRFAPPAPLPLHKRPQHQAFRGTKVPVPQPTLPIPRNNLAPLGGTPRPSAITTQLHTLLLIERDSDSRALHATGLCVLLLSPCEERTPCNDRLRSPCTVSPLPSCISPACGYSPAPCRLASKGRRKRSTGRSASELPAPC